MSLSWRLTFAKTHFQMHLRDCLLHLNFESYDRFWLCYMSYNAWVAFTLIRFTLLITYGCISLRSDRREECFNKVIRIHKVNVLSLLHICIKLSELETDHLYNTVPTKHVTSRGFPTSCFHLAMYLMSAKCEHTVSRHQTGVVRDRQAPLYSHHKRTIARPSSSSSN
jgi:hypothetical protein